MDVPKFDYNAMRNDDIIIAFKKYIVEKLDYKNSN